MNLEPETRNGYYISSEMKKVWQVELLLLEKLLEVCKNHNLRVFAEGGTLLGTIREHGFIPWDDDIDVAMLREDYDKLLNISQKEFTSPFFFQSGYSDEYYDGISKLRLDGTTAILPYMIWHKCHQGIFIDIFPLDTIPEDSKLLESFIRKRNEKKNFLERAYRNHLSLLNWSYNIDTIKAKIKVWKKGITYYFADYEKYVKQYSGSKEKKVSLVSWKYEERYTRLKDWYEDLIYMPFEDIMIPVPKDYDLILAKQYGDYMKPVKEPSVHGGFEVLDASCSYKVILPKIRRKYLFKTWGLRWKELTLLIKNIINKCKHNKKVISQ